MDLEAELLAVLEQLNEQTDQLKATAERMGIPVTVLVDKMGRSMYLPILLAEANAIHALALLRSQP